MSNITFVCNDLLVYKRKLSMCMVRILRETFIAFLWFVHGHVGGNLWDCMKWKGGQEEREFIITKL